MSTTSRAGTYAASRTSTACAAGFSSSPVALSLLVAACHVLILASSRSITANTKLAPRADAALLRVPKSGRAAVRPSAMLAHRILAAEALWRAGRVRRILVTGDEALRGQVSVMARELQRHGVPCMRSCSTLRDRYLGTPFLRAREGFRVAA